MRRRLTTWGHCAIVAMLVLGVLTTGSGLVLTTAGPREVVGVAYEESPDAADYPCAGHLCGCTSREACLAHCCCFGPSRAKPSGSGALRPAATDDAPTGLTLRSATCAGTAPWLMAAARLPWLPDASGMPSFDRLYSPMGVSAASPQPSSRSLPVVAPPPQA